jgi:hypothetical protein
MDSINDPMNIAALRSNPLTSDIHTMPPRVGAIAPTKNPNVRVAIRLNFLANIDMAPVTRNPSKNRGAKKE